MKKNRRNDRKTDPVYQGLSRDWRPVTPVVRCKKSNSEAPRDALSHCQGDTRNELLKMRASVQMHCSKKVFYKLVENCGTGRIGLQPFSLSYREGTVSRLCVKTMEKVSHGRIQRSDLQPRALQKHGFRTLSHPGNSRHRGSLDHRRRGRRARADGLRSRSRPGYFQLESRQREEGSKRTF